MAAEKQATEVVLLDVRRACDYADYFVLLTAETRRQTEAVVEDIDTELGRLRAALMHREGNTESGWVLMDFGDVIVHVFAPEEREYYRLEQLWSGAMPLVRIQ